jgi:hypothetical protein
MPKVIIHSSVIVRGVSYHPNSGGVEMPESHAKSLGFGPDDYLGHTKEDSSDLPEGLFMRAELGADDRFNTVDKLIENKDKLTDIDGIGAKRAEQIISEVQ